MQNDAKCEDTMEDIFGAENLMDTNKIYSQEISLYSGDDFEAKLNLEMCEDCKWNWINLNVWVDSRGRFKMPEVKDSSDTGGFKGLTDEQYKEKTALFIDEIKSDLEEKDIGGAMQKGMALMTLTNEWNQVSNDVWKSVEEKFSDKGLSEEERRELSENYGWIKREQEKRKFVTELSEANFEKRKAFYNNLFSGYETRESYFEEIRYEKRLIESFATIGRETCDNNMDDNQDGQIDCAESVCGGQLCGKSFESVLGENNETTQVEKMLYCIQGTCQAKEESIEITSSVCGNNVCEEGEELSCTSDCVSCPVHEAVDCSGKIIFSGEDQNGCPLEPICLTEELSCQVKEDCANPLCGEADCVEGACKVISLGECRESECEEGEKKIKSCASGEQLTDSICENGVWKSLELECSGEEIGIEEEQEETISYECSVAADCGGENDVCSNGKCVSLPSAVNVEEEVEPNLEVETSEETEVEPEAAPEENTNQEEVPEEEGEQEETSQSEPSNIVETTGGIIFNFFRSLIKITGFSEEGGEAIPEGNSGSSEGTVEEGGTNSDSGIEGNGENSEPENSYESSGSSENEGEGNFEDKNNEGPNDERNWEEDNEDRKREESERRENECEDRCSRECYDMNVRPCVDDCIWKECGDELDCDVDQISSSCEETCKGEDLNTCESECKGKCLKGENTWVQPEKQDDKKMNTGGFQAGGSCKTAQGMTNGFIWFGGWGENFERIEPLKQKYYMSGDDDWCKREYESLVKQRAELEKGLNEEFAAWFFEEHLANSAEDWESLVSGIYELYWKDVETVRELTFRMKCAGIEEEPEHNLIKFEYESEYGSIEFWEEIKEIDLKEMGEEGKGNVITPYMRIWVFPSKEFFKYEMKKAMENHKFPGNKDKAERENEEGLTEEEKMNIRQDRGFMKIITEISEKYGGNFNGVAQIKDFETGEVVFNMMVEINEEDLIKMEPMPYSEIEEEDVRIEIDFEKVYDFIYTSEKEMGGHTESPPWDRRVDPIQTINEVANGIKSFFKIRSMIGSSKVFPEEARGDVEKLLNAFIGMMMKGGGEEDQPEEDQPKEN
ncbi:MAG: hypothetical protein Q8Q04_03505 [archaeon]|nr:hypothetical protein [archaeon]